MTPLELTQWESNSLERRRAGRDGRRRDALRQLPGLHLRHRPDERQDALAHRRRSITSKCWRMQPMARMLDPSRFAIVASGEHVWSLARDIKDQNFLAPFQLTCRRADNGEVVWKSADLPDYAALRPGRAAAPGRRQALHRGQDPGEPAAATGPAAAVRAGDPAARRQGALEDRGRHVPPGPAACTSTYNMPSTIAPAAAGLPRRGRSTSTPTSACWRGSTPTPGRLDWGYGYKTDPFQSGYRFFYYYQPQEPQAAGSPPLASGEAFLVKGMQSDRLYAVDPNRMKVLWERPITKAVAPARASTTTPSTWAVPSSAPST